MANGGRTWIGYQIRPEFEVEQALMDEFKKTFEFVKEREDICKGAAVIPYIAILHSSANHFTDGDHLTLGRQRLLGTHKMLLESGFHFNFLDEKTLFDNLEQYQVVILPDQRYIDTELADALREFVKNGGSVIGTQLMSTLDDNFNFTGNYVLSDLFGIKYVGKYEHDHSFIEIKNEILKRDVLDMPQQAFGECVLIKETTAEVLADLWEPLLMEDGRYIHQSSPPGKYTGSPAITVNTYGKGKGVFLSNDIFGAYYLRPQWNLKNLFRNLLNDVIPEKLVEMDAPSNVEVVLAEKGNSKQVHLVNHYRDKALGDSYTIVENVLPVYDIKIKVKADQRPGSVELMPEGEKLKFDYDNGCVGFTVPKLHIYSIAVIY
jgi:beta-galactosidase GanA